MQIDKLNQSEIMSMVNLGVYSIELPVIKLLFQETEKYVLSLFSLAFSTFRSSVKTCFDLQ